MSRDPAYRNLARLGQLAFVALAVLWWWVG